MDTGAGTSLPLRPLLLGAILAGFVVWIVFDGEAPPRSAPAGGLVAPDTPAVERRIEGVSGAVPARLAPRTALPAMSVDPFSPLPPAAPPQSPAETVPTAKMAIASPPVLPLRYVGRLDSDSATQVFLGRGEDVFPVRQGDNLDGGYRVESLKANSITLLHVPTGERQILDLASPPVETGPAVTAAVPAPVPTSTPPAASGAP